MRVILLGPPGAGKGTQARQLGARWVVPVIATGDMLREAAAAGTPLGRTAQHHMETGELVPDDVIIGLAGERLSQADARKGFVLDGFPRTPGQAAALSRLLEAEGLRLDRVVLFDIAEAELVRRLTGRRVCRSCGRTYHVVFAPPAVTGRCDSCPGELYQRSDDEDGTVRRRLQVYARDTAPLVEHYRQQGLLETIDGSGGVDEVLAQLIRVTERGR
jgi:adenylate kinase